LLAIYLVATSLTTLRPPAKRARAWLRAAATAALAIGASSLLVAARAMAGSGGMGGPAAVPLLIFGGVALLAGAGDIRCLRSGNPTGARRIARHLWRMCFALFIAAGSFFIGQADEIPKPLRIMPLLATPVLAVLAAMAFWLWRVRRPRGLPAPAAD
jgi:peptidoglycan/LPS O-acetylase OafA/YrhL